MQAATAPLSTFVAIELRSGLARSPLSLSALAARASMPRAAVAAVLAGGSDIDLDTFHRLALILGMDPWRTAHAAAEAQAATAHHARS